MLAEDLFLKSEIFSEMRQCVDSRRAEQSSKKAWKKVQLGDLKVIRILLKRSLFYSAVAQ